MYLFNKFCIHLNSRDESLVGEDEQESELNGTIKSMEGKSMVAVKPPLTQSQIALKKKREAFEAMQEAAYELFNHFNHKNLDALVKLVRFTLEKLRKRITASQAILAYSEAKNKGNSITTESTTCIYLNKSGNQ